MRILTPKAMRALETASEQMGVPCAALMENAGAAAAEAICARFAPKTCVVLCGNGNNGGDGLVAARCLKARGVNVLAVLVCGEPKTPLAANALRNAQKAGVAVREKAPDDADLFSADVVIDAVFGIGFHGRLPKEAARLAGLLQKHPAVAALDLPSGLSGESPSLPEGGCFSAALTLCLEAAKPAVLLPPSSAFCGEAAVLPIGVPKAAYKEIPSAGMTLDAREACAMLPERAPASHKGSFGRLLVIAGCGRYRGAASLAALGALRGGAGIVTLASVEPVLAAAASKLWEPTLLPLKPSESGTASEDNLRLLLSQSQKSSALLIGCGLGCNPDTAALTEGLLLQAACPLVLDADALNVLKGRAALLREARKTPVATPHVGEMARLTGLSAGEIKRDPVQTALRFAAENRCVAALKDASTVVAAPDGRFLVYPGGNSGLSRGGSGDLLAGLLGAFLAQGMEPFSAAAAAVTLHGEAGKRCAARRSLTGMLPHELTDDLCGIFLENGR